MKKPIEFKMDMDLFILLKAIESRFDLTDADSIESAGRMCDTDEQVFYDVKIDWSYPIGIELNM